MIMTADTILYQQYRAAVQRMHAADLMGGLNSTMEQSVVVDELLR